jgi:hypothetical protein
MASTAITCGLLDTRAANPAGSAPDDRQRMGARRAKRVIA